jgi:uncharacterized protein (TIGR02145 family)
MKKILIGFIAVGLLTFVGCEKDDDTETTDSTETSSDDESTDTSDGSTDASDEGTDSSTDDDTTETSSGDGSTDCDDGTTETSSDEIADSDGNTYKTVIIGEQEWFAENLKTSKYNDGTAIPNVTNDDEWANDTTGASCHYDNHSNYECTYGKLYNWYAVETGKLCPTGWHVPKDAEWTVLTDYLAANGHNGKEGTALKSTSGWDYDGHGTDDYGFLGLPGGTRGSLGAFLGVGYSSFWWSSSQFDTSSAWCRVLDYYNDPVYRSDYSKRFGMSVRCLRD